jgi:hypothetical protein
MSSPASPSAPCGSSPGSPFPSALGMPNNFTLM